MPIKSKSMSKTANNIGQIYMKEEFEKKIRPDLKDISNTVEHLLLLSDYFVGKGTDWSRWRKENDKITRIHQTRDKEFIQTVEAVYVRGVETAQALGDILPKINSIERCPRLKDYISEIKKIQENWIPNDRKLIARCKKIIRARKPLDYSDVELMLRWHKEHLKILRGLDDDLSVIEGSKRYKTEEQKQLQDQTRRNAAPAKGGRIRTYVKRIPRWIYVLVLFLAALLTCIYLLWWLWTTFWKN